MNMKKDAKKLLNGECVISNYVKSAKQIKETYDYIIELPVDMTAKKWLNIQKVSDGLIYGKQESMRDSIKKRR